MLLVAVHICFVIPPFAGLNRRINLFRLVHSSLTQHNHCNESFLQELLTSSPRAANIYSYCAMSSVIEFAPIDIEQYIMPTSGQSPKMIRRPNDNSEGEFYGPVNDHIPPEEKLEIALEMAKCIAVMHGFKDGVIASVDVQVGQFFRGRDGMIKLVDYNRAEASLYDINQDRYCKYVNGHPADGVVSEIMVCALWRVPLVTV